MYLVTSHNEAVSPRVPVGRTIPLHNTVVFGEAKMRPNVPQYSSE